MQYLNFLYFIILSIIAFRFTNKERTWVKYPLLPTLRMPMIGVEYLMLFLLCTGLIALSGDVGSMDLMAIRLLMIEFFCVIAIFKSPYKVQINSASVVYMLFIAWMLIGLTYSPAPDYGVRVILKYLAPLLMMLFGTAAVRESATFFKIILAARKASLIILLIVTLIPWYNILFPGVIWYATALAINFFFMSILSFSLFYLCGKDKKDLIYAVVFLLPIFFWIFRSSMLAAMFSYLILFIFIYKLRALPALLVLGTLGVLSLFYLPPVKEKMFIHPDEITVEEFLTNNIDEKQINSNGRFAMWEWSKERFYVGHEWTGSGTGNLQQVFYSKNHPFGRLMIIHNDHITLQCDVGNIGYYLFWLVIILIVVHAFFVYNNTKYNFAIRVAALTSGATVPGMFLAAYAENVVNYSMATYCYTFATYGMMVGLIAHAKNK